MPETNHRVVASLRKYNEMCATDADFDKPRELFDPTSWNRMGAELDAAASLLVGDKQVFVSDRARDCRQRADYVRRVNRNLMNAATGANG